MYINRHKKDYFDDIIHLNKMSKVFNVAIKYTYL